MADYDILFCHPEAFLSCKEDLELLQSDVYRSCAVKAAVVVDEAYCILEWGTDNFQTRLFQTWCSCGTFSPNSYCYSHCNCNESCMIEKPSCKKCNTGCGGSQPK